MGEKDAKALEIQLENSVRTYAYHLFMDSVTAEYSKQIEKWKIYINHVIDAEKDAHDNFEKVLTAVNNRLQEQAKANAAFIMLAFSLVAGPLINWALRGLTTAAMSRLSTPEITTRLTHISSSRVEFENGGWVSKTYNAPTSLSWSYTDYSKSTKSVFGSIYDALQDKVDPLLSHIGEKISNDSEGKKQKNYNNLYKTL